MDIFSLFVYRGSLNGFVLNQVSFVVEVVAVPVDPKPLIFCIPFAFCRLKVLTLTVLDPYHAGCGGVGKDAVFLQPAAVDIFGRSHNAVRMEVILLSGDRLPSGGHITVGVYVIIVVFPLYPGFLLLNACFIKVDPVSIVVDPAGTEIAGLVKIIPAAIYLAASGDGDIGAVIITDPVIVLDPACNVCIGRGYLRVGCIRCQGRKRTEQDRKECEQQECGF